MPRARWRATLGMPVVPPVWKAVQTRSSRVSVKSSAAGFSFAISRARSRTRARCRATSFGRISGTIQASGGARPRARSTSSTVSTAGASATASATFWARSVFGKGLSVTTARAPHSRRISAMCSTESSGLTGATTPAVAPASSTTAVSTAFGST